MDPRLGVRLIAATRAVLGGVVLLAPGRVASSWLGADNAAKPVVRDLARSLGARDVALGLATIATIDDPTLAQRLQLLCALVDGVDVLATMLAARDLPVRGVLGTVALAGSAAGAGVYLSARLGQLPA